jgi:hypothetical protein
MAVQSSTLAQEKNVHVAVIGGVKIVGLGKGDCSERKEITPSG